MNQLLGAFLPKTELIAKYSGVCVAERFITHCTPGAVVEHF